MPGSAVIAFRLMPVLVLTALILLTDACTVLADSELQGDIAVVAGYRQDRFDWNIAGNSSGQNPNILSELTWRDLQIYQFGLAGRAERVGSEWRTFLPYVRASAGYGVIVSGENQDSDYLGDSRTLEFSRSNNSADSGSVIDLSLAGGGKVCFHDRRYSLAPLLGFSYYGQNLTLRDGYQTISVDAVPLGPISGLRSTYEGAWFGPWLGLDATALPAAGWMLSAGVEVHQVFYRGEGNWNLRTDLAHPKSFEHEGNGYGLICRLGSAYALTPRLELTVAAELRNFSIKDGTDWAFLSDGSQGATRLNEVNWESKMLTAGVLYHF